MLYHQYLSAEALDGFKHYKYNCKDTNPLSIYVLHPFWNKVVLLCPRWIAPNLLTLVGFMCCVGSYALPAAYDPSYAASTLGPEGRIPGWAWVLSGKIFLDLNCVDMFFNANVSVFL